MWRKKILKKYAEENAETILVPKWDSRQNLIVVECDKPEQLNDISTTCSISPNQQESSSIDVDTRQDEYYDSEISDTKEISYIKTHLPNLEVTKLKNSECLNEQPKFSNTFRQEQCISKSDQIRSAAFCSQLAKSLVGESSSFSMQQNACGESKKCQNEGSHKNYKTSRQNFRSEEKSIPKTNSSKSKSTSFLKSKNSDKIKR